MQARVVIAIALVVGVGVLSTSTVLADPPAPGSGTTGASCAPGSTTCTVSAGTGGSPGQPGSSGSSGAVTCSWQAISSQVAEALTLGLGQQGIGYGQGGTPLVQYGPAGPNDSWYSVTCSDGSGFVAEVAPGPGARATPAQAGQLAVSQLNLLSPTVSMAPPTSQGAVVNLESWLWISPAEWHPITATATVGGIAATATATPEYVVWSMGNGQQVTCNGPGTPYNPALPDQDQSTTCGYTYQETSAGQTNQQFAVTTTVFWHVTWTSVGVAGGGDLGIIPGRPTTTRAGRGRDRH